MKRLLFLGTTILFTGLFLTSCGDPTLDITEVQYEPKLVVQGFLFQGKRIEDIRVLRNFPLNRPLDTLDLFLKDVTVSVNGIPLKYNPFSFSYYHDTLIARAGEAYTLQVKGTVDGKVLEASGTTVVPVSRFRLQQKTYSAVQYDTEIPIRFVPDCSARFYAFSIRPETVSLNNFIYENHYVPNLKREDIEEQLSAFAYQFGMILHVLPSATDTLEHKVRGLNTWFYGNYTAIIYAGDDNFRNYFLTTKNVQELDGNFHEPLTHIDGEGIGVFASAVADTITFRIER